VEAPGRNNVEATGSLSSKYEVDGTDLLVRHRIHHRIIKRKNGKYK
jgi:hypothetical protein